MRDLDARSSNARSSNVSFANHACEAWFFWEIKQIQVLGWEVELWERRTEGCTT